MVARGQQLVERGTEGAVAQPRRLVRVQDPERRVEPGGQRVGGEQPATEGVDRHHPGALSGPGEAEQPVPESAVAVRAGGAGAAPELGADPRPHLSCSALGEREREQPVDLDPVVDERRAVAVDEHGGLPGPGARLEEGVAATRGDRSRLLRGRLRARAGDRHLDRAGLRLEVGEGELTVGAHAGSPPFEVSSPTAPSARSRRQIG